MEPQLPRGRVSDDPPFTNSGIDFAGPIYVTADSGTRKAYICLFTCQITRAIHLELVTDLSIESFLQAFRRFASRRRGLPALLLTDDAKTFKSASKKVHRILRSAEVQRALANKLRCSVGVYYRKGPMAWRLLGRYGKERQTVFEENSGKNSIKFRSFDNDSS